MTKEDKDMLLKDLCARLPYGVICDCIHDHAITLTRVDVEDLTVYYADCDEWEDIKYCKPYLRPMSSMTEEEWSVVKEWFFFGSTLNGKPIFDGFRNISAEDSIKALDWLLANHFDFRGLIEKGLALEAPEGMYKF